jgi:hypothetical protein
MCNKQVETYRFENVSQTLDHQTILIWSISDAIVKGGDKELDGNIKDLMKPSIMLNDHC